MDLTNASRDELLNIIAHQAEVIAALEARIKELQDELAKDSHNSSKPPSTDRSRRGSRSLREPSGKKPGGQLGHPGQTLRLVDKPDRTISHRPEECRACGASLTGVKATEVERRQVIDLPPLQVEVTEHQAESVACPHCGEPTVGTFPAEVTQPVQYGPRFQALGVYLQSYQLLPYERIQQLFDDLLGTAPSTGTLQTGVERCAARLVEAEGQIKDGLRSAETAHFDETGFYVEGKRHWLHVASNSKLTHYGWHAKRGKAAIDELDILPKFRGQASHDEWSPYLRYDNCQHSLCNAHRLRELTFIEEQYRQSWPRAMKELLLTIKGKVDAAKALGETELDAAIRRDFEEQYQKILDDGFAVNPRIERPPGNNWAIKQTKPRNLLERLSLHKAAVLAFMHDFRAPFDNSQAERDIRMVKVQQKISGCFRSDHGATAFCRIRSYLSTLRKQGQPMLAAIERVFTGEPLQLQPALVAE